MRLPRVDSARSTSALLTPPSPLTPLPLGEGDMRTMDFEHRPVKIHERAGPGIESAHASL